MDQSNRKKLFLLVVKKVHESLLFTNPQIKYILMKNERKPQFIIGIFDDIDEINCIYEPCPNNVPIFIENLEYSHPIFSEMTESCEEGYILSMIDEGYEPIYIDIQTHAHLWDYIDYFMTEMDHTKDTIIKYLEYCRASGIHPSVLIEYSDMYINDLYAIYINDKNTNEGIIHE